MNRSPFADTRFEYEVRHLYYIEDEIYSTLEKTKPCFLIGSRGTGKTTLLRSLSWRERFSNSGLRERLGGQAIRRFIGIYIKLPDVQLEGISQWLRGVPVNIGSVLYSRYLELLQLQEMLDAIAELGAAGEFNYSPAAEMKLVKKLLEDYEGELFIDEPGSRLPISFSDLAKSVRKLRRIVERASQQNVDPLDVIKILGSPTQFCALSRAISNQIASLVAEDGIEVPYFKICFDEAETLDSFGVKILNTWVRLSEGPLYHVISYVSRPQSLSDTFLPHLTVQSADVEILQLDLIKDRQFKSFAEGVVALRLREFTRLSQAEGHDLDLRPPTDFSTERLFGKLNINFLLEDALRNSVSPFAKELLKLALKNAGLTPDLEVRVRKGDDSSIPIYETYLQLRTNRIAPSVDEPKWSKRRASSQGIRKAMIAAYLSIMHELKTPPKYAYADMILQLSDNCIRDYLNNLEYVYREAKVSLASFLGNGLVRPSIQNSGLCAASKAKVNSLPTHGVNHPSSTAKLIAGLGEFTSILQSQSKDGSHLKTTERGIFQLDITKAGPDTKYAVQIIVEAAEAGFLKILEKSDLILAFRVHTSLAPAYGFSYRGAYYPVNINATDILAFIEAVDDKDIKRIVTHLFSRFDSASALDLFGEDSSA